MISLMTMFLMAVAFAGNNNPELGKERIIFKTNFGDVVVALYPKVAPKTSEHILKLAKTKAYVGTEIFRLVPHFVLQVGEVTEEVRSVPLEVTPDVKHEKSRLSLAHHHQSTFGRSSFSFILEKAPHLDLQYTVFGEVVRGWENVLSMSTLPRLPDSEEPEYSIIILDTLVVTEGQLNSMKLADAPDLTQLFKLMYKKKLVLKTKESNLKTNVLYSFIVALVFLLAAVMFHLSKRTRASMSLVLLSILVLVYGLFEYILAGFAFPVSWVGLCLFILFLITLRLMSRFENL